MTTPDPLVKTLFWQNVILVVICVLLFANVIALVFR